MTEEVVRLCASTSSLDRFQISHARAQESSVREGPTDDFPNQRRRVSMAWRRDLERRRPGILLPGEMPAAYDGFK
jgi:hypothetical protein